MCERLIMIMIEMEHIDKFGHSDHADSLSPRLTPFLNLLELICLYLS